MSKYYSGNNSQTIIIKDQSAAMVNQYNGGGSGLDEAENAIQELLFVLDQEQSGIKECLEMIVEDIQARNTKPARIKSWIASLDSCVSLASASFPLASAIMKKLGALKEMFSHLL